MDAIDDLAARVNGLEYQFVQIIGIVDSPLSPTEAIDRLRELREGLDAPASQTRTMDGRSP